MKLSALRLLQRDSSGAPPPRVQGSSHVLELLASVLERAYLIRTDPRGEGFRWYPKAQWHALAVAIAECYVCNDAALIRRLWPLIEASSEHDSKFIANCGQGMFGRPMEKLMRQTRNIVSLLLLSGSGSTPVSPDSSILQARQDPALLFTTRSSASSSTPVQLMSSMPITSQRTPMSLDFTMAGTEAPAATTTTPSQVWYPFNQFADQDATSLSGDISQTISDSAWGMWEDFVNGLSSDEVGSASDNTLGHA